MRTRHKTRKRGGGAREKLVAWINYVLEYANSNGWEKFPMIEMKTNKNGKIVKTVVEMEASESRYGMILIHFFPSTKQPMSKKYATGLAMHLWNPQKGTGTNYELYRRFESQYHNNSNIESLYGNESLASRSHSPVRGRNITSLHQHLDVLEEKVDSGSAGVIQAPLRRPTSNAGIQTNSQPNAKNESNVAWDKEIHGIDVLVGAWFDWVQDKVKECTNAYIEEISEDAVTVCSQWYQGSRAYSNGFGDVFIVTKNHVYHSSIYFSKVDSGATHFTCSFYTLYEFNEPLSRQICKIFVNYASSHLVMIATDGVSDANSHKKRNYDIHTNKFMAIVTAIPGVKFSPLESGWTQVGPGLYFNVKTNKKTKIPPYQSPPITYS